MPDPNRNTVLEVDLIGANGDVIWRAANDDEEADCDAVDYVSLVSPETYGKPALVAPGRPEEARADVGETVLYINTSIVGAWTITRVPA